MDEVEAVVVGAGVIGLAAARALALAGREVIVLERAYTIGFETSSRNSEVIHGGLYYPKDSLKAATCVAGRAAALCLLPRARRAARAARQADRRDERGRDPRGTEDRGGGAGERRRQSGMASSASEAQRLEPELHCVAALLSPSTGIIDSHALMLAYQGEAESGRRVCRVPGAGAGGRVRGDGFELRVGGDEQTTIRCRCSSTPPVSTRRR